MGQRERGLTIERACGSLAMQTFKKLPIRSPKAKTNTNNAAISID